ncbi:Hemolysin activation/secretion protein [Novosphingobium sp. B1]|nr:Hemolysin activation/secretion protein [Novosphingobium sp. B1]
MMVKPFAVPVPRSGTCASRGPRRIVGSPRPMRCYALVAVLAFGVWSGAAVAQSSSVAAIQPPTREEIQRGVAEGTLQRRGSVSVDAGEVERSPCPLAAPEFSGIRLKLSSVSFSGMQDLPGFDLSGSYAEFVGTDQPVAIICEIRDRAATALRQAGYLAAVQVPPQKIDGGAVRLDVLLVRLTRIQVKGDPGRSEGALLRYLDKLRREPVFNSRTAERYLLLAKDLPGMDVRLALRPIEGSPGEVVGEVSVRQVPIYAEVGVQNYGSVAVGRYSALARVQINGLTGLGDSTVLSFFATPDLDEQKVVQVAHEMRIGGEGFALRGDFTYGWTNPTVTGATSDFHSRTLTASLEGSYPFVRAQAYNLTGALGMQFANQDLDFGNIPLNRDRLRVLYARVETNGVARDSLAGRDGFTPFEPHWAWGLSFEARQGLDVFDATNGCRASARVACAAPGVGTVTPSRVEGTASGFVLRASGVFDYRPVRGLTFSLQPRAQYSPDRLLSYEEYSGGNYTIGRGYDPGAVIGDSGIGARAEVRVGSLIPRTAGGTALQPYAFVDAAWVWNNDYAFDGLDPQKVVSIGAGLRASIREAIRLDAGVAIPLHDPIGLQVKGDARFLLNLSFQLLPWRL